VWRAHHWRNYFTTGTIALPLPVIDDNGRKTGQLTPWLCERPIYIRRDSVDRFIASHTAPSEPSRASAARRRYAGDAELFEKIPAMLQAGMTDSEIGRRLASEAQGASDAAKFDRIRREAARLRSAMRLRTKVGHLSGSEKCQERKAHPPW
jgi:hypothetical protein